MLAQAAGNLAQMGCKKEKMSKLSTEHYALAIQHLRRGLEDDSKDFSLVLAGVLTLIMAEVNVSPLPDCGIFTNLAGL